MGKAGSNDQRGEDKVHVDVEEDKAWQQLAKKKRNRQPTKGVFRRPAGKVQFGDDIEFKKRTES